MSYRYSIGTPGQPWGEHEKAEWLSAQFVKRSYAEEVVAKIDALHVHYTVTQYGALPDDEARYPLFSVKTKNWQDNRPTILITGGVHGYETSGVQGALGFLKTKGERYQSNFNLLVLPCISPWGYETINRWDPLAIDPNRSFYSNSPAPESRSAMEYIAATGIKPLAHFDLHETTDTDNSEFRPALAARDAIEQKVWDIPDGFYTVDDSSRSQPAFQRAVISSVEQVTHIAPADPHGNIIGAKVEQNGVIHYDKKALFLCGGFTDADYVTTTEVYPDSASATPAQCTDAQIAAICGGLDYLIEQGF